MANPNKTVARARRSGGWQSVESRSFQKGRYGECVAYQEEMKAKGYITKETRQKDGGRKVFVYKKVI